MYHWNVELENYRKESLKVARDLGYPEYVKNRIKEAKTVIEISNILTSARKNS